MAALLRILRLLALVVWVGGLIFFAFVVAPVAFSVLPSPHQAGLVVAGTLRVLNQIANICGILFLAATALLAASRPRHARKLAIAEILCVLTMMLASLYIQLHILPAMERDRIAAGGDVDAAPPDNPARLDFERLHPLSEKIEGAVLLLGVGVVVLLALEDLSSDRVYDATH